MTTHGSLPSGWRELPFGSIVESITERIDDPSSSGLEYYVGLEHLDPDTLAISRWGTPSDVEATKLKFYPGDVIYARRRAYQRKLGVARWEGICSAHALVLRARPEVCWPEFLPYFLQSDQFHRRALDISVGSLSPTINWKTLAVQRFVLPPINEQRRIASELGSLDAHLQSLREAVTAARSLYFALGASIHERADEVVELGDVLDVLIDYRGKTPKKLKSEFKQTGVPVISAANIKDGRIVMDEVRCVDEDVWSRWMTVPTRRGDLLMTSEAPLGSTAVVESDKPLVLGQRLFGLRVNEQKIPSVLVRAFIDSPRGQSQLGRGSSGSTVTGIRASALMKVAVPLPSQEASEALRLQVEAALQVQDHAELAISSAESMRVSLREHLLAVNGV